MATSGGRQRGSEREARLCETTPGTDSPGTPEAWRVTLLLTYSTFLAALASYVTIECSYGTESFQNIQDETIP